MYDDKSKSLSFIYSKLWKNRIVEEQGDKGDQLLREKIKRELLDENSHPRVRKSRYEKFYLCLQRVHHSQLSDEEKIMIISVYMEEMEKLAETPM